jgi:hypothetical protein
MRGSAPSSPRRSRASTSTGSGSAAPPLRERRRQPLRQSPARLRRDLRESDLRRRRHLLLDPPGHPFAGGARAVTLSSRNGVLIDLRSSKEQGQSNFVNPGTMLLGVGADFDLTPRLRLSTNVNHLWFQNTSGDPGAAHAGHGPRATSAGTSARRRSTGRSRSRIWSSASPARCWSRAPAFATCSSMRSAIRFYYSSCSTPW